MNTRIGSIVDENTPFEKHWIQEERLPLNIQKFTEFRQKFLYPYVEPQGSASLDAVDAVDSSISLLTSASGKIVPVFVNAAKYAVEFKKQLKQLEEITKNNKTMQETIYYVDKKEVKIGDKISLNGWNVTLTEQLIKDCPDMFEVKKEELELVVGEWYWVKAEYGQKYDALVCFQGAGNNIYGFNHAREWTNNYGYYGTWSFGKVTKACDGAVEFNLLEEANRRYPEGTRFVPFWDGSVERVIVESKGSAYWSGSGDMGIKTSEFVSCPYLNGEWAEIVEPIMTSEDGVDMYEGGECWCVNTKDSVTFEPYTPHYFRNLSKSSKNEIIYVFSTKQAAEEWIKENKPKVEKTLNDYGDMLLNSNKELDGECVSVDEEDLFDVLKQNYPKLYWTQILQLIADDLNEDWKADFDNRKQRKSYIDYEIDGDGEYTADTAWTWVSSSVLFKNENGVEKAIELMGDKLDYIFK